MFFAREFRDGFALLTSWFWTTSLQNCEIINCWFLIPPFSVFYYSTPDKLIHRGNTNQKKVGVALLIVRLLVEIIGSFDNDKGSIIDSSRAYRNPKLLCIITEVQNTWSENIEKIDKFTIVRHFNTPLLRNDRTSKQKINEFDWSKSNQKDLNTWTNLT